MQRRVKLHWKGMHNKKRMCGKNCVRDEKQMRNKNVKTRGRKHL